MQREFGRPQETAAGRTTVWPGSAPDGGNAPHPDDVLVLVTRRDAPLWRVVQELETATRRA